MNTAKGWRTLVFNALTLLAAFLAWPGLAEHIPPQWIVLGVAAVNFILRFFTDTAAGKKE